MNQKKKRKYKKKKPVSPRATVACLVAFCLLAAACFLALAERNPAKNQGNPTGTEDAASHVDLAGLNCPTGTRGEGYKVCLDAGHGGKDPGACANGYTEAADTLEMTLMVQQYLEAQGCEVIMTRTDDSYPSLEDRVYIANQAEVDALIAIHRNMAENPEAEGVEVWIHSAEPENAVNLANCLLDNIGAMGLFDISRGVQAGTAGNASENYLINKQSRMASCILELGFISSENDNTIYHEHMQEIAESIAGGILDALEANSATGGQ